jgi:RND family efflux transporter MFP subunit
MKKLFHSRYFYVTSAFVVILAIVLMMFGVGKNEQVSQITSVVETGSVRQLVSVSGIAEAEQSAELAFPVSGIVKTVHVKKGDVVSSGDILVELDQTAQYVDRADALSLITLAVANRDELVSGPTNSDRDVTSQTLEQARDALTTTKQNEERKISNAYQNLLSGGLTVYSDDPDESAVPPTVSGSYTCDTEGTYSLTVYSSSAQSGYSYRITGIESGTYTVSTQQAVALGECGLRIQFDPASNYNRTVWNIDVPNTKSTSYISNRNTYALTVTQAESAIENAQRAVTLAEANATNENAAPRTEALVRANTAIEQARAQLARIDTTIQDRILRAPFAGTVTDISILPGEAASTAPVLTLLAKSDFEITARIPEIDLGKIQSGQSVELVFDAKSAEVIYGSIDFVSLQATEIDGVAYYEAHIILEETPQWIRSGLNADVDIIIDEVTDNLRIPKRFLIKNDGEYSVLIQDKNKTSTSTVELVLEGNDGFVAISGLNRGDIIIAP